MWARAFVLPRAVPVAMLFCALASEGGAQPVLPGLRIVPLAEGPGDDCHPYFSREEADRLYRVWDSQIDSGNTEVFLRQRSRGVSGWGESIRLSKNPCLDQFPAVAIFRDDPIVVWETQGEHSFELVFCRHDSVGWSLPQSIRRDEIDDRHPTHWRYPPCLNGKPWLVLAWERAGQLYWGEYGGEDWRIVGPVAPQSGVQRNAFLLADFLSRGEVLFIA
ncbi:MAG: hypothetical protein QHJ34_13540 [bacterium]|jgi:hypothetical protein|nr:hypothetical protein [candidate division KSB1 bacterium]MDH7561234.1 hypothetical protein [bacterium]